MDAHRGPIKTTSAEYPQELHGYARDRHPGQPGCPGHAGCRPGYYLNANAISGEIFKLEIIWLSACKSLRLYYSPGSLLGEFKPVQRATINFFWLHWAQALYQGQPPPQQASRGGDSRARCPAVLTPARLPLKIILRAIEFLNYLVG